MWVGLLGPLSIASPTAELRLTAPHQRTLLAALAVRACEAVAADTLAEALWDGELPPSWTSTLRNEVKRLRSGLGLEAGRRVVTQAPGYRLELARDQVDVFVFQRLCDEGRGAARAGDWQHASSTLASAEALWRGTPLADVPSQNLRDEHVPFLVERRLQAEERRIEADLHLTPSRAPDVIPELRRFTRKHPDRDHPRALLMLALYRCGRKIEALAVYREAWKYYRERVRHRSRSRAQGHERTNPARRRGSAPPAGP